jgi:hypothetical protein
MLQMNYRLFSARTAQGLQAKRYARCNGNRERNKIQKYQQGFL